MGSHAPREQRGISAPMNLARDRILARHRIRRVTCVVLNNNGGRESGTDSQLKGKGGGSQVERAPPMFTVPCVCQCGLLSHPSLSNEHGVKYTLFLQLSRVEKGFSPRAKRTLRS